MNLCSGCTQAKKKVFCLGKLALTKCSLSTPGSSSGISCERCILRGLPCSGPLDSKSRSCRSGEKEKDVQSLRKILARRGLEYFVEVSAMAISGMTQVVCNDDFPELRLFEDMVAEEDPIAEVLQLPEY